VVGDCPCRRDFNALVQRTNRPRKKEHFLALLRNHRLTAQLLVLNSEFHMNRLLSSLICLSLLSCKTTEVVVEAPKAPAPIKLTIVGTNDVHGWVLGQKEKFPKGDIKFGGVAAFSSYLKILREQNPDGVILVDAGDLFQGTLISNLTEGAVVIDAFNRLKYDAATIGNHEFDYGPSGPISAVTPGLDAFGALKERVKQAKFPLLSTNIYDAYSSERPNWLPADGTVIVERNGIKIGLFGLTTPTTPSVTLPTNVASLRFGDLATESLTASKNLRERGAQIVIAIVHAGGKCADVAHPEDLSSCDTDSGEIFEMMKGLPDGTLDAVVAGHTHQQMGHFINGTPVIESWALGRYFGTIELSYNPTTKRVLPLLTRIHSGIEICETYDAEWKTCDVRKLKPKGDAVNPVPAVFMGKPIEKDILLAEALAPAETKVTQMQQRDLGLTVLKTMGRNYEDESALGSFLADSLRKAANADVAFMNPGGIRADLKAGKVTYGDVYEVLPFDNYVSTVSMNAEQLESLVKTAYGARKGVFQVSGLEINLGRCPTGVRLKAFALPGGKPIDKKKKYVVAMPDFLARGGDGLSNVFKTFEPFQFNFGDKEGKNMRDVLIENWVATKETFTAPGPGRVLFVDNGTDCSSGAKLEGQ
jgi:5'-nucleotidase